MPDDVPAVPGDVPAARPPAFDPADPLGLDDLLDEEDLAIRAAARRWAAERVLPYVAEWYERGEVPVIRDLARELGALGALGMTLRGYGCAGASAVRYGLVCLELEAADSAIRSLVSVQGSLAMRAIHRFGSEEQRQRWLPPMAAGEVLGCFALTEPEQGSDPAGMRTRAERDGSDWLLTGRKAWITNGSLAGVAVVWARAEDGVRGFAVPTDASGFHATEIRHKGSLRASVTSDLVLDRVRLPADAALPGARGLGAPLSCLDHARYGIAWGAMGAARSCFEAALSYAGAREQFGRPVAGFQLTQAKLADMAASLHTGLLLAHHLGRRMDAGTLRPEQVSLAKLRNVREALAVCRTARTVLGANGISLEYPVMRHAQNLESVLTYEGTEEMHQLVLGKALTGLDAFRG
ncbi:acyl-CoA dehydrogenase family protein [Streptomyces sp. 7-21]|uniref:acyl-CoA dehydrogenase family protein n=1 Tax=Streptomyces sp. 7-21 TaxID=2802283 RepID=UPI00191DF74F|nr:acyl-CoA dehydrogenase family protein [Streptomyces sp. 7-21]MBL1068869.1 acyl-CoA dehydrogenase family protein [Streptomyces sp. 7-21]